MPGTQASRATRPPSANSRVQLADFLKGPVLYRPSLDATYKGRTACPARTLLRSHPARSVARIQLAQSFGSLPRSRHPWLRSLFNASLGHAVPAALDLPRHHRRCRKPGRLRRREPPKSSGGIRSYPDVRRVPGEDFAEGCRGNIKRGRHKVGPFGIRATATNHGCPSRSDPPGGYGSTLR